MLNSRPCLVGRLSPILRRLASSLRGATSASVAAAALLWPDRVRTAALAGAGAAAAGPRADVAPRKLLASLRKMGDSLPTKQGRLLSILKSLLGPDAGAADALAALARLVTAGQVVVAPGGAVSYRL